MLMKFPKLAKFTVGIYANTNIHHTCQTHFGASVNTKTNKLYLHLHENLPFQKLLTNFPFDKFVPEQTK
jgi:hypothetical protein